MATECYTIKSHYNADTDKEWLQIDSGQIPDSERSPQLPVIPDPRDIQEEWNVEAQVVYHKRRKAPPTFVPATYSVVQEPSNSLDQPVAEANNDEVAGWYRSLTLNSTSSSSPLATFKPPEPSSSALQSSSRSQPPRRHVRRHDKDWFIQNALPSPSMPSGSTSSLADMLARDPPPKPTEAPFQPRAFLAIGPSNKGFEMLSMRGWSEGEPLGPSVVRPPRRESVTKTEEVEEDMDDDVKEIRRVEVVDLTLSDSEEEKEEEGQNHDRDANPTFNPHHTALITPIATVLKSDRLGIGLKAMTTGPHKASLKRVTHSAEAIKAHNRANEAVQRRKKRFGKGRRGLERKYRKEMDGRMALLAYMND